MTPDLQAEAAWLAGRTTAERRLYLDEVAHNPLRGPAVAEQLRELVFLCQRG